MTTIGTSEEQSDRGDSVRLGCERYKALTESEHASIAAELSRIEEAATYSSQTQFSSAKFWRGLNLSLGAPAAALAATAGTTVLADVWSAKTGAVIALVSAGGLRLSPHHPRESAVC